MKFPCCYGATSPASPNIVKTNVEENRSLSDSWKRFTKFTPHCKRHLRKDFCALRQLERASKHPTRFQKQNTLAWWKLMNPPSNVWNHLYSKITKTIWQAKEKHSMTHHSSLRTMKIPDAKAAVDKECKKLETIPTCLLEKIHLSSQKMRC